MDLFMFSC